MKIPTLRLIGYVLGLSIAVLMTGCGSGSASVSGRWVQTGIADVYGASMPIPMEAMSQTIEFRDDGKLVDLAFDAAQHRYWLTNTASYAIVSPEQIQVTGTCSQGNLSFSCTSIHRFMADSTSLHIFCDSSNVTPNCQTTFKAIGAESPTMEPSLIPPGTARIVNGQQY